MKIVITSKQDGFRRAGVAHPAVPTAYTADQISKEQLAALQAEPMLVVEILPDAKATGEKPKAEADKVAVATASSTPQSDAPEAGAGTATPASAEGPDQTKAKKAGK